MASGTELLPCRFDARWRAGSKAMQACAERFYADTCAHETRKRQRRYEDRQRHRLAVEALLCNLAVVTLYCRSIGRAAELEVRIGTRASQSSEVFGEGFTAMLETAERMGLLTLTRNRRVVANGKLRSLACVMPNAEALSHYLPDMVCITDLALQAGREPVLQLRTPKDDTGQATRVPLPRTPATLRMTQEMRAVNAWLAQLPVTLEGAQAWSAGSGDGRLQSLTTTQHTRMTRIFNNDSLRQGGRLYGAWWLNMTKDDRRDRIRIDGLPVCHVDFRQMNLRLAYAHAGVAWPFDTEDAYIAAPYGERSGWKELTNALLFARNRLSQFPGASFDERTAMQERFNGKPATEVYAAIRQRHNAVAGMLECDAGFELQRTESDILMHTLRNLQVAGIPALPVHDALVVASSHAEQTAATMRNVSHERLGVALPVAIE